MKLDLNMHVHTWRSACAKPEMTLEAIEHAAASAGIRYLGLSDHIDRLADNDRPKLNRLDVGGREWEVDFLIGCEATVLSPTALAITTEVAAGLDYVMVSANHYHLASVENPDERKPDAYASHYLTMLDGVLAWGLADIVAHPFLHTKIGRIMNPLEVIDAYPWDGIERLLARAGEAGVSFEIKPGFGAIAPEFFSELVRLARRNGVRFSLGTDAHRISEIAYPTGFIDELLRLGIGRRDIVDPEEWSEDR